MSGVNPVLPGDAQGVWPLGPRLLASFIQGSSGPGRSPDVTLLRAAGPSLPQWGPALSWMCTPAGALCGAGLSPWAGGTWCLLGVSYVGAFSIVN